MNREFATMTEKKINQGMHMIEAFYAFIITSLFSKINSTEQQQY